MRDFLIGNGPLVVGVLLLIEAAVLVCLLKEHKRAKVPMALCMVLVTAGLMFDGAVILLGRFLPEGLLKVLSMGRYLFHGLCMPLLLMISVYALGLKGTAVKIFWGVAALLMALGAVAGLMTKLNVVDFAGFLRCTGSDATPKWADSYLSILSVAMVIPLILVGIWLMIKKKGRSYFSAASLCSPSRPLGPPRGTSTSSSSSA